jgi:cell division protein FtsL
MFSIFIISLMITKYYINYQIRMLEEMLEKADKDNKILMQLINHHKKTTDAAKNKVSRDVQILNLFITMVS